MGERELVVGAGRFTTIQLVCNLLFSLFI